MILTEHETKEILARYGIPVTKGALAANPRQAVDQARVIGFPLVMKISSREISHKSDIGGVLLNIKSEKEVVEAYTTLLENARRHAPSAKIEGVLVQQMVPSGLEVIIGAKKDPQFDHALMFGLGGIFVEICGDVSFRVAPITQKEALEMIAEIKGYQVLKGIRGKKPYDIDAISDILIKVSEMVEKENILELDINPLIVYGQGAIAADARAMKK